MLFFSLIIVISIISAIMIFLVLIQSGKGGGLAGIAAGGATTQILGARQAPDILEKATWTLATLFIALCILTNFVIDNEQQQRSVIQQQTQQQTQLPLAPQPDAQPAQPDPASQTPPQDQN